MNTLSLENHFQSLLKLFSLAFPIHVPLEMNTVHTTINYDDVINYPSSAFTVIILVNWMLCVSGLEYE